MRWNMRVARLLGTLAVALVPLLAGCGTGTPGAASTTPNPMASPTSSASRTPSAGPSPSTTVTPTGTTVTVPVYWVGATERGPRLYREYLPGTDPGGPAGPAVAALRVMIAGQPLDPDYTSLWPRPLQVDDVQVDGATATVWLSGPLTRQARTAQSLDVQQLVHTVTAALEGVREVAIDVNGTPLVRDPVSREPQVEVLGPVWVTDPQQTADVARPLRLSGSASVFEATVSWELRRDGVVVRSGFSTATAGAPERGVWSAVVRGLPPGSYVVAAWETSMKDGSRLADDDKAFTLR